METEIISLNSDRVNRYGYHFALSGLEESIKENFNKGIPMCVGHDLHRAFGWITPFALYFEPNTTRVLGRKMMANNEEEYKLFRKAHQTFLRQRYSEAWQPHQEHFLNLIGKHLSAKYMRIDIGCVAVYDLGIVWKVYPELFSQKDHDDLLPLSLILKTFNYLGQGIFKDRKSDLTLFAHTYFRRSQSVFNNFHFYFLDELLSLKNEDNVTIKLSLSEDLIGYGPSYHETMEMEYHWGPKFSGEIDTIKHGLAKYECDDFQRAYYGISRSEFYWKRDASEITFEMEELRDQPSPFEEDETYHCRYLHAIYNAREERFIHFDGAVRSYNLDQMSDRLDKTFLEYGRKALYKKLFRIDGQLPLHQWKLLTVHYLQGNPLIYEYFGLDEERELQSLQPKKVSKIRELLPFSIEMADGIRLLVSYNQAEGIRDGRYIDCFDSMSNETETIVCVENLIYELKRSLQRLGEDLEIPKEVRLIKVADRYWNIPSIMHGGPDWYQLLNKTLEALAILFQAMIDRGKDMDISLTLGCIINNRLVRVSSYGNILNQVRWIRENMPFPFDEAGFSKWVIRQRNYISQFPEKFDDPLISSIAQVDGVLYIRRKHIKLPYIVEPDDKGIRFDITMPPEGDELYSLIERQQVKPKLLSIVNAAKWSDTGESYYTSTRSKFIDNPNEVSVKITDLEPIALYWSKD